MPRHDVSRPPDVTPYEMDAKCPCSRLRDVGNGSDMRRLTGVAALAALGVTLAACTSGGTTAARSAGNASGANADGKASSASAPAKPAGPAVRITPASGTNGADPSAGITVSTTGGTLTNISVRTSGDPVTGSYSSGKSAWRSTWALNVSQSYTVTASATAANGATTTRTSTFRTLTPSSTFTTEILEG